MQNLMISRFSENGERSVPKFITYVQSYCTELMVETGLLQRSHGHLTLACLKSSVFGRPQLNHLAGVFKFLDFVDRFRKTPFSVTENAVLVWTVGQTGEKKDAFSNLTRLVWTELKSVSYLHGVR